MCVLITFYSVQHAYRAEKICKNAAISCKLIAVPLSLSKSCNGLALEFSKDDITAAAKLLEKSNVKTALVGVQK